MTKVFTQDDLIRYIYGETSNNENEKIESLLCSDDKFQELYTQLQAIRKGIDHIQNRPSETVIQRILDYSKTYNLYSESV